MINNLFYILQLIFDDDSSIYLHDNNERIRKKKHL
jgi:hypothetical protein